MSLAFRLGRQISSRTFWIYTLAQTIGGVLGAWSAHLMFRLPIMQIADATLVSFGLGFSELLMTSGLIFVIFIGVSQSSKHIPALVAVIVTTGYFMSSSSIVANPAVTVACFRKDVPTTIGMTKVFLFIAIRFLATPLVVFNCSRIEIAPSDLFF